jgi:glycosyltransferase involved in cell wall biosynthesis
LNIALDATPLLEPTGGVCRYTSELTLALAECCPEDEFWLLSDQPFPRLNAAPGNVRYGHGPQSTLERRWWLWGLQSEISRLKIDVFHGTDFAVPYVPVRPSILTLHDLSPWLDPAWHTEAERVRSRTPVLLRLGLATLLLTPSEAIRREAIARFRVPVDRIVSVPHAASAAFRPVPVAAPETPFFLFVGTLEPRKNVGLLIDAWREVRKRHRVDLILAGRRRYDFPELAAEEGLHLLGAVSNERLPELYSACAVCVYPSFYEGFGLPVLEAMQCGAAVIASRDPAILETSAGAAVALDARDTKGWIDALTAAVENPAWVAGLREKSLRRAADFSWAKTAQRTREVYDEAIRRFRGKS